MGTSGSAFANLDPATPTSAVNSAPDDARSFPDFLIASRYLHRSGNGVDEDQRTSRKEMQ